MRRSRPLSLVVLIVGLLALAGCGGGGSSQSAAQLLRDTFGPNHQIRSGKLQMAIGLQAQGVRSLKGPVSIRVGGPFQSRGKGKVPAFDFTLDLSASGQSFSAGAVSTGNKAFLTFAGNAYTLPDNVFKSFEQNFAQAQNSAANQQNKSTLASLGISPINWLQDPSKAGTQNVGGTSTVHIRAGVKVSVLLQDISKLLSRVGQTGAAGTARLPSGLTPQQQQQIQRSVKSASLDVYTGKDDQALRRLVINLVLDVPADLRTKATAGLTSGNVSLDVQFSDLNHSQTVSAPRNAQPLSNLSGAVPGLGGAAGGGAGGATPGAGSGAAPGGGAPGGAGGSGSAGPAPGAAGGGGSAGANQAYLQCLQRAGQNIAEVQKCAGLLGQ